MLIQELLRLFAQLVLYLVAQRHIDKKAVRSIQTRVAHVNLCYNSLKMIYII